MHSRCCFCTAFRTALGVGISSLACSLRSITSSPSTIEAIVEAENLRLACDLLVHFAHWITPTMMPKRFDTHFFLVAAPADQLAMGGHGEVFRDLQGAIESISQHQGIRVFEQELRARCARLSHQLEAAGWRSSGSAGSRWTVSI